jgi:hypothetical protein
VDEEIRPWNAISQTLMVTFQVIVRYEVGDGVPPGGLIIRFKHCDFIERTQSSATAIRLVSRRTQNL